MSLKYNEFLNFTYFFKKKHDINLTYIDISEDFTAFAFEGDNFFYRNNYECFTNIIVLNDKKVEVCFEFGVNPTEFLYQLLTNENLKFYKFQKNLFKIHNNKLYIHKNVFNYSRYLINFIDVYKNDIDFIKVNIDDNYYILDNNNIFWLDGKRYITKYNNLNEIIVKKDELIIKSKEIFERTMLKGKF